VWRWQVLTEAHWEELLLFLVGSTEQPPGTLGSAAALGCSPLPVTELLMQAGLAGLDSDSGELAITDEGFQFLLTDAPSQLWVLLRKYVEMSEMQGGASACPRGSHSQSASQPPPPPPHPCPSS